MLVNLKKILQDAEVGQYAVGGFNMTSLETALGIIRAAEQEKSPVILQLSEKTIDYMGLDLAGAIAKTLADRASVPVVVHLDHGKNLELFDKVAPVGFSSVMVDVSHLPRPDQILIVKKLAEFIHRQHLTIEAECDVIGGAEDYVNGQGWQLTKPEEAAKFVQQTGVDCFAVSIGNGHGKALPNESLDLELLSEINEKVSVPLVLHGASSTKPELIREAISRGVHKINIDTDLRIAFSDELRQTLEDDQDVYDPRDELEPTIAAVAQAVVEKIRLFGSNGKA